MTAAVTRLPFEFGKTIVAGHFRILEKLGKGGMGDIYAAEDVDLCGASRVVKVLQPRLHPLLASTNASLDSMDREVSTTVKLASDCDSFITVFAKGKLPVLVSVLSRSTGKYQDVELDLPFYVMERLNGCNLEQLIEALKNADVKRFLSWNVVLYLCAHIARAVQFAHARGVIHRDLKGNNLFLHKRIDRDWGIKLIDFGISSDEGAPAIFGSGTTRYAAPEQLRLSTRVEDTSSDIYSLCLVLFELAALVHPMAQWKDNWAHAHLYEAPPLLAALRSDAPRALVELLARGLSKTPEERPTAKEIATTLDNTRTSLGHNDATANAQLSEVVASIVPARRPVFSNKVTGKRPTAPSKEVLSEVFPSAPREPRGAAVASGPIATTTAPSPIPAVMQSAIVFVNGPGAPPFSGEQAPGADGAYSAEPSSGGAVERPEPVPDGKRVLLDKTDPGGPPFVVDTTGPDDASQSLDTDPTPVILGDDDDLPVFTSMGAMFGTLYQSSPFGVAAVSSPNLERISVPLLQGPPLAQLAREACEIGPIASPRDPNSERSERRREVVDRSPRELDARSAPTVVDEPIRSRRVRALLVAALATIVTLAVAAAYRLSTAPPPSPAAIVSSPTPSPQGSERASSLSAAPGVATAPAAPASSASPPLPTSSPGAAPLAAAPTPQPPYPPRGLPHGQRPAPPSASAVAPTGPMKRGPLVDGPAATSAAPRSFSASPPPEEQPPPPAARPTTSPVERDELSREIHLSK